MNKELNLISEAYVDMLSENLPVAPSEAILRNAEATRAGKSHTQMADDHEKYAAHMIRIGQTGLGYRSRLLAAQHRKLAESFVDSNITESFNETDDVFFHPQRIHLKSFTDKDVTKADHEEAIRFHQKELDNSKSHKDYPYSGMRARAAYHEMRVKKHKEAKAKLK